MEQIREPCNCTQQGIGALGWKKGARAVGRRGQERVEFAWGPETGNGKGVCRKETKDGLSRAWPSARMPGLGSGSGRMRSAAMRITSRGVLAREREAGRSWRKGRLGIPAASPPTAPCPLRTGCCVPLISPQHPASWAAQGLGHPGDPGDPSSARPCLRGFHFRLAVGGLGPQREARTVGLHCGLSLVGYRPCHWRRLQRQPAWESGSLGDPRRQLPSSTLKFATRPQSGAQSPAIQDPHFILPLWSHAAHPRPLPSATTESGVLQGKKEIVGTVMGAKGQAPARGAWPRHSPSPLF